MMYDPREGPSAESQKFTNSMLSKKGANNSVRMRDESSVLTNSRDGGTRQMMGSSIETREGAVVHESSSEDDEDNIERESIKDSRKE